jgi:hypothetical protein
MVHMPSVKDTIIRSIISNILTPPYKRASLAFVNRNLDSHFSLKFPDMVFSEKELDTSRLGIRHVDLFPYPIDYIFFKIEHLDNTHMPLDITCLFMQVFTMNNDLIVSVKHKHTSYESPERLRGF